MTICVAVIGYFLDNSFESIAAIASDTKDNTEAIIRIVEWREQVTTQNSVPREVLDLLIAQQKLRIDELEDKVDEIERRRP